MKIGIFDSGLGGLIVLKSVVKKLPEYDYIYLGDTKRVPYGDRSQEVIYQFTKQAVEYLFRQNCKLVVLACNTASSRALRKLQKEFLPKYYPDRKILGVIIPTVEAVNEQLGIKRLGIIATQATVDSKAIVKEYKKLNSRAMVYQNASPVLVPLIENNGLKLIEPILKFYLKPLLKKKIQAIVLGCTHYAIVKKLIKKIVGPKVLVFSQDEIVPTKLKIYLNNHPEVEGKLSRNRKIDLRVTDLTDHYVSLTKQWFDSRIKLKLIKKLDKK